MREKGKKSIFLEQKDGSEKADQMGNSGAVKMEGPGIFPGPLLISPHSFGN
jgi:hypothetical protein